MFKVGDYPQINKWFVERCGYEIPWEIIPKTGFLVDDTACGFIYLTNSKVAFLDLFVSNKNRPKEDRKRAIQLIVDKIIELAQSREVTMLMCNTKNEQIKQYAIANGFNCGGEYTSFARRI